jgi:lysozyme
MMQLSSNGLDFIKKFESLSLPVYLDQGGLPTIGYGHLLKPGENFKTIDLATADELLRDDTQIAVNVINVLVSAVLNQNQFDALVSFCFNIGVNAFKNSTMLTLLTPDNAPCFISAANQFMRWIYVDGEVSQGLSNRREQEKSLFMFDCNEGE